MKSVENFHGDVQERKNINSCVLNSHQENYFQLTYPPQHVSKICDFLSTLKFSHSSLPEKKKNCKNQATEYRNCAFNLSNVHYA